MPIADGSGMSWGKARDTGEWCGLFSGIVMAAGPHWAAKRIMPRYSLVLLRVSGYGMASSYT